MANLVLKTGVNGGIVVQGGSVNFNGAISNSGTGTGQASITSEIGSNVTEVVQESSSSTLVLSADNKLTGQVILRSGTLRAKFTENALGAGTLRLEGGTLQLANNVGLAFNRNTIITGNTEIQSDRLQGTTGSGVTHTLGSLAIGGQTLTLNAGAAVTSGTAGLTFGAVTLTGSATFNTSASSAWLKLASVGGNGQSFTVGGIGNTTIAGAIATSSGALFKTGSGLLILSASNNFTGGTTIAAGTIRLGNANALGDINNDLTVNGGLLDLNGNTVNMGALSGSNGAVISSGIPGSVTLTAGSAKSSAFAGSLQNGSGTMGLTKTGSGALTLSGVSSYTGSTRVTGGRLLVSGSLNGTTSLSVSQAVLNVTGVINGAATVNLGNGGVLSGNGSLGPVVVGAGGMLAPGNAEGIGRLNVGALSGTTGAVFSIQLGTDTRGGSLVGGTDYDQVAASSGISLGGMTLSISATNIQNGDLFFIILNRGAAAVSGYFVDENGVALQGANSSFYAGGHAFTISTTGNASTNSSTGGKDVVLIAIPEPDPRVFVAGAGIFAILRWVRRRNFCCPILYRFER